MSSCAVATGASSLEAETSPPKPCGPQNLPADVAAVRQHLASDPYRPLYHFLAPQFLVKDPNGLIYWKGKYHLLYQNNPNEIVDGKDQHWGHAVSDDLVYWTDLPVALTPDPEGSDRGGCWSGPMVVVDGVPTAVYYGNPGGVSIARAHPEDSMLIDWVKFPGNPIVRQPPEGSGWRVFDPGVWKYGDTWHMICGGRQPGRGDTAYLLTSKDFVSWEYHHEFYKSERKWTAANDDCAVPQFFKLGDRHVLLFSSHRNGAQYYVGRYAPREYKFYPQIHDRLNHCDHRAITMDSGNTIAPATLLGPKGRRIYFSWMAEGLQWPDVQVKNGWGGIMTLPQVLTLGDDNYLRIRPVTELKKLRHRHRSLTLQTISAGTTVTVDEIRGDTLELAAVVEPAKTGQFGIALRRSPGGEEQSLVLYDWQKKEISVDVRQSSKNPDVVDFDTQHASLALSENERLELRIFVDRSVVEVFANERRCLAKRIYPSRADSVGVALFAKGSDATVVSLEAWDMKAIWPTMAE